MSFLWNPWWQRREPSYDLIDPSTHIVCPYCQNRGGVRTEGVKRKQGLSGGKLVAAIVTFGFTLLLTGLSRKVARTQLSCATCGMTWDA